MKSFLLKIFSRYARVRVLVALVLIPLAALVLLVLRQKWGAFQFGLSSNRCNVLFLSIDTLRADHLRTYGYELETAPNISKIAETGVVFEKIFAVSPVTLQSHMSMLTGLYPNSHKVLRVGNSDDNASSWSGDVLSTSYPTVMEIAKAAGYSTVWMGGFPGLQMLNPLSGFSRGVDQYFNFSLSNRRDLDSLLAALKSSRSNGPFFAFVHSWIVHAPYAVPREFAIPPAGLGIATDPSTFKERVLGCDSKCLQKRIAENGWARYAEKLSRLSPVELFFRTQFRYGNKEDAAIILSLYDNAISYVDYLVGRLVSDFSELGWLDHTVIAISSDHGEAFFEHGWLGHGDFFDNVIHVPFVLKVPPACAKSPEMAGTKRVAQIGSSVDIVPTLLGALGEAVPVGLDGHDLLSSTNKPSDQVFGFSRIANVDNFYVRSDRFKIIDRGLMDLSVYDLRSDPDEKSHLKGKFPPEVFDLLAHLRRFQVSGYK